MVTLRLVICGSGRDGVGEKMREADGQSLGSRYHLPGATEDRNPVMMFGS